MIIEDIKHSNDAPCVFDRVISNYKNNSDRFLIPQRSYERQYAPYYGARLNLSLTKITKRAKDVFGTEVPIKRLCDIGMDERIVVIGTLWKYMELRPSILKEISEEHHVVPQAVNDCYASDDDYLILEDDLQRITLKGNIDPHVHVTGVIAAVLGSEQEDGKFLVEDICFSGIPDPMPYPVFEKDRYVMIVSGCGLSNPDVLFPLQMLIDFVTGGLGDEAEQEKASQITRVIIAGNSISESSKDKDFSNKAKYLTRKVKASSVEGIKGLDDILVQLAASVDVDVMPGEYDPANHLMPQQPLHPCMFPKASKYSSFHLSPNPYDAEIDGVRFLGTSGQNVKDIMSYSKLDVPLTVMEKTLDWGHISPTAPDTLNCYPFFDEDPFLVPESPNVYFAGNMAKLHSKTYGSESNPVTIICVPKFWESFTAVLFNLKNKTVEPIAFAGEDF